jgi:hypothetical protein
MALLMVATVVVSTGAAAAAPRDRVTQIATTPVQERERVPLEHCVAEVTSQAWDGELMFAERRCYDTFSEAISDASEGEVSLDAETPGSAALTEDGLQSMLADFTIGIHYDGANGSGSSIVITGSGCTGGWWNTGSTWGNRISSSYNGCYRLRHYDYSNKSGMNASTTGAGARRNLPSIMDNKTNSVSYHSS